MRRNICGLVLGSLAVFALVGACSKDDAATSGAGATAGPTTAPTSGGSARSNDTTSVARTPGAGPSKYAGFDDPVYAKGENWLCGPGAATDDRCERADLDATVVKADGSTEIKRSVAATSPTFDCFYVYPTVNFSATAASDDAMAADTGAEDAVTRAQAARFREVCRVYAPLYRQSTLGGYGSADRERIQATAYGDVRNAFKHYMSHWNQGRPVLLVGHSQGSGHLTTLLKDEFDSDPQLRAQLVSAMLAGGFAQVNESGGPGGSFTNLVPCQTPDQTGCVIGFNSVAADTTPADLQRWGGASNGNQRLCTNPGALAGGPGPLDPIVADQEKKYTTPWVELPGALTAECRTEGGATTLLITPTAGDPRDLTAQTRSVAGWGLHINEVNLVHGDLVELARRQGAAMPPTR